MRERLAVLPPPPFETRCSTPQFGILQTEILREEARALRFVDSSTPLVGLGSARACVWCWSVRRGTYIYNIYHVPMSVPIPGSFGTFWCVTTV